MGFAPYDCLISKKLKPHVSDTFFNLVSDVHIWLHVKFIQYLNSTQVVHLPFEDFIENSSKFKIINTFCQLCLHKPLPLPSSKKMKKMYPPQLKRNCLKNFYLTWL